MKCATKGCRTEALSTMRVCVDHVDASAAHALVSSLVRRIDDLERRVLTIERASAPKQRRGVGMRSLTWMDGAELRRARMEAGWTAAELGRAVGVTPHMINRWERGVVRVSSETAETLVAIFDEAGATAPTMLASPMLLAESARAPLPVTGRWAPDHGEAE